MAQQIQIQKVVTKSTTEPPATVDGEAVAREVTERRAARDAEIDALLAEIDEALGADEEQAAELVANYVQKGGQ